MGGGPSEPIEREYKRQVPQDTEKVSELETMLEQKREEVVELTDKVGDLEAKLLESTQAKDTAIDQKKEWQLQAASIHAKMEKYRDRYEQMLDKFREEQRVKLKSELLLELSKQEVAWREQLRKERELRTSYERILLNLGYTPGANASKLLGLNPSKLSQEEAALQIPVNSTQTPILPSNEHPQTLQFYSLKAEPVAPPPSGIAAVLRTSASTLGGPPLSGSQNPADLIKPVVYIFQTLHFQVMPISPVPDLVLVQNTFINVQTEEDSLPRTFSDQTHARARRPLLVAKIEPIREDASTVAPQGPEWHEETASMGELSANRKEFTKFEFDGRLSMVTESEVRSQGIVRYLVHLTSGELSPADGVGFVFSDRLPCRMNIQLIDSIFISRRGLICTRVHDGPMLKHGSICPLLIGMSVELVVDLDRGFAQFAVHQPGACLGYETVEFGALAKRKGFLCAVLKNAGVTLTLQ